jgi:hypothetical protein
VTRRAPEAERDHAAMALAGYLLGVIEFAPDGIPEILRDGLMARLNQVRRTQGLEQAVPINTKARRVRAAAE